MVPSFTPKLALKQMPKISFKRKNQEGELKKVNNKTIAYVDLGSPSEIDEFPDSRDKPNGNFIPEI